MLNEQEQKNIWKIYSTWRASQGIGYLNPVMLVQPQDVCVSRKNQKDIPLAAYIIKEYNNAS